MHKKILYKNNLLILNIFLCFLQHFKKLDRIGRSNWSDRRSVAFTVRSLPLNRLAIELVTKV